MMMSQWRWEKCVQKWWCQNESEKSVYINDEVTMNTRKVCTKVMMSQWKWEKCVQKWWGHSEDFRDSYWGTKLPLKGPDSERWWRALIGRIFTPTCLFRFRLDTPFAMYIFIMFHLKADLNQYILIKYTYNVLPYRKYFCREQWPETTTLMKGIVCFYFSVMVMEPILCHLSVLEKINYVLLLKSYIGLNTFLCTFS